MELCSSDFFIVHTFFWDWIIIVTLFLFFFLLIITAINCNYAEWVQVSKIIMDFRTKARERERERFYWYMYYHFFSFFVKLIFMLKDLIKNLFCLFYFMVTCYKRSSLFTSWTFSRLMKFLWILIQSAKCKCIADKFEFHLVFFQWRFIRAIQFSKLFFI